MRAECTWTPLDRPLESTTSKLHIYDAGDYVGYFIETLPESIWLCWRILNRESHEQQIRETLEEMPQDWVPFQLYSHEEFPLIVELGEPFQQTLPSLKLQIPGWTLQFREVYSPPPLTPSRPLESKQSPSGQRPARVRPPENKMGDILIGTLLVRKEDSYSGKRGGAQRSIGYSRPQEPRLAPASRPPQRQRDHSRQGQKVPVAHQQRLNPSSAQGQQAPFSRPVKPKKERESSSPDPLQSAQPPKPRASHQTLQ